MFFLLLIAGATSLSPKVYTSFNHFKIEERGVLNFLSLSTMCTARLKQKWRGVLIKSCLLGKQGCCCGRRLAHGEDKW